MIKGNLIKNFSFDLNVKPGDLYVWSGKRVHKGNLNTSNKISCAIQFKLTEYPATLEASCKFNDFKALLDTIHENNSDQLKIYKERFENYLLFLNDLFVLKNDSKETLEQIKILLNKYNFERAPDISFALSILSQRLRSMCKILKEREVFDFSKLDLAFYFLVLKT